MMLPRIALLLSVIGFTVFSADPSTDPQQLLQQLQSTNQIPGGPDGIKMLDSLKRARESALRDAEKTESEFINLNPADSAASHAEPGKSVYQDIFGRSFTHPDSIINHLQIFGHKAFSSGRSFDLNSSTAQVPASYPVGVGDEIHIYLWGRISNTYRLAIGRDGTIEIPQIGPVAVVGKRFSDVQKELTEQLEAIEGVNARVSLGRLRTIQVYIMGEVKRPGVYSLPALSYATDLLFAAGGPTAMGSLRNISIKRNNRTIRQVDFYDFLIKGINPLALNLQPNDVIHVPIVTRMAAVAGNVRRNAIFELRENESLYSLLKLAGGISPAGSDDVIQIQRLEKNSHETIIDVQKNSQADLKKFPIKDGDLVKVFPLVDMNDNAVFVEGNVKRPGTFALTHNMRITDIIDSYKALLPETYFKYSVIYRYDPPSFLARIIPFNLRDAIENPNGPANISLQAKDKIYIFHQDFFEPYRMLSIRGAVTSPGEYKLMENMRLRDVILQAGGLLESASEKQGELYRRRFIDTSYVVDKIDFCVSCAMENDPRHNLLLQRFDEIYIRQQRGWEKPRKVTLLGEFIYPGEYILLPGETLGDIVHRSGGFTDNADTNGIIFTRESVRQREKKRMEDYIRELETSLIQLSLEAKADADQDIDELIRQQMLLIERLRQTDPVGRVVIDMNEQSSISTFLLEDQDRIIVPPQISTVSVIGQVFNPATFRYSEKHDKVKDYIERSGGYKPTSDKKNVYVIKSDGSVVTKSMVSFRRYDVEAGDAIVVPQKLQVGNTYSRFIRTVSTIASVLNVTTQTLTAILLTQRINNE